MNSAEETLTEQDVTLAQSETPRTGRFRRLYDRYKAKGKWFLIGFFVYYLIRDTLLYIVLPYFLAKNGISLLDWLTN